MSDRKNSSVDEVFRELKKCMFDFSVAAKNSVDRFVSETKELFREVGRSKK